MTMVFFRVMYLDQFWLFQQVTIINNIRVIYVFMSITFLNNVSVFEGSFFFQVLARVWGDLRPRVTIVHLWLLPQHHSFSIKRISINISMLQSARVCEIWHIILMTSKYIWQAWIITCRPSQHQYDWWIDTVISKRGFSLYIFGILMGREIYVIYLIGLKLLQVHLLGDLRILYLLLCFVKYVYHIYINSAAISFPSKYPNLSELA